MAAARALPYRIRPLLSADAIRPVERLQYDVWGFEPSEVVPLHVLLTAARHGGLLLGAAPADEPARLVGLAFGFLGRDLDGTPVLCSHLLAVAVSERGRGLGAALKWAQRDVAIRQGLARIVWTFDPLEHANARLNLSRLGATSDRYLPDLYGEIRDELNAGMPTDRLEVTWELHAPQVADRAAGRSPPERDPGPLLDPDGPGVRAAEPQGAPAVRLRAPAEVQRLRREDPEQALAWRLHLRDGMTRLFAAGYAAVGAGTGPSGPEYRFQRTDVAPGHTVDRP